MRVLHLAPLWVPIHRDAPGGIETFLAHLFAASRLTGCEPAVIACAGSSADAELLEATAQSVDTLMEAGIAVEYAFYEQHQLSLALQYGPMYDVIHSHIGPAGLLLSSLPELRGRVLHTIHTPVRADLEWFIRHHPDYWYSTVSQHQLRKLQAAGAKHCEAIHNGLDVRSFSFQPQPGPGLLFIGRMEAFKGPDIAARVAHALHRPMTLAGPIIDRGFFEGCVVTLLNGDVRYVGVVDHQQKVDLFGKAACAILPVRWDEPFGMVALEAMACGTPVVALARGALPEIVEPGLTGFLGNNEEELPALVERAMMLDRAAIRARVAHRFGIATTARRYDAVYRRIIEGEAGRDAQPRHASTTP